MTLHVRRIGARAYEYAWRGRAHRRSVPLATVILWALGIPCFGYVAWLAAEALRMAWAVPQ